MVKIESSKSIHVIGTSTYMMYIYLTDMIYDLYRDYGANLVTLCVTVFLTMKPYWEQLRFFVFPHLSIKTHSGSWAPRHLVLFAKLLAPRRPKVSTSDPKWLLSWQSERWERGVQLWLRWISGSRSYRKWIEVRFGPVCFELFLDDLSLKPRKPKGGCLTDWE